MYVTSDLTWSVHCEHIIKKSNRRLYALRKLKKCGVAFASSDILLVYCAIIRPLLEYASVVFGNLPQSLSNDLEKVQKRALSIIYPNCSYEDALKVAGIDSLESRGNVACKRFVETILPGNPLYSVIHNCSAPQFMAIISELTMLQRKSRHEQIGLGTLSRSSTWYKL